MPTKQLIAVKADLLSSDQNIAMAHAGADLLRRMRDDRPGTTGLPLVSEIWPSLNQRVKRSPTLVLQGLDRIGGEGGKSGNLVLEGHFAFEDDGILDSRRLIVKISPNADAIDCAKKLKYESNVSKDLRKLFASRERFALPVHQFRCPDTNHLVLWAPFASGDRVHELVTYLSAAKIPHGLSSTERRQFLNAMITALGYLREAHCTHSATHKSTINPLQHYSWELRGVLSPSGWARPWHELWGAAHFRDFGEGGWPSPFRVCQLIRDLGRVQVRTGVIHGDLHPRNIVFAEDNTPRIIDFGWARPLVRQRNHRRRPEHDPQHIAKDFVLLEANLRFMTLPPYVPMDDVKAMAEWNIFDKPPPAVTSAEIRLRMELIQKIRATAQRHCTSCDDWDIEYTVPLFLVSLGLLKHCSSADCTWAARYNVLALAQHVRKVLSGKRARH